MVRYTKIDFLLNLQWINHVHFQHCRYSVVPKTKKCLEDIDKFIRVNHFDECGIIYCLSRMDCEKLEVISFHKHVVFQLDNLLLLFSFFSLFLFQLLHSWNLYFWKVFFRLLGVIKGVYEIGYSMYSTSLYILIDYYSKIVFFLSLSI